MGAAMTAAESVNEEAGELDIAAIEARANKATPGPWDASGWVYGNATTESYGVWAGKPDGSNGVPLAKTSRLERGHADAEFIAHAREDVPALIAEVRRLSDVPGLERQLRDKIAGEAQSKLDAMSTANPPITGRGQAFDAGWRACCHIIARGESS